jgi:hypothetical protein
MCVAMQATLRPLKWYLEITGDNLNTTQTLECSKGKYNVKIINESLSKGLTNNLCRPKARNKKEAKRDKWVQQ